MAKPADIPRLLDEITAYHQGLQLLHNIEGLESLRDTIPPERYSQLQAVTTQAVKYKAALDKDIYNSEGEEAIKLADMLEAYCKRWIRLS